MEENIVDLESKRIEKALSKIGARIARATDLSKQAKEMSAGSESILIHAQQEIEALYLSLEEEGEGKACEE